MIRPLYWHAVPSKTVLEALPLLTWVADKKASPAVGTAALMLYVALLFMSEELPEETALGVVLNKHIAAASYDDLHDATALSRSLISKGLTRLVDLQLIKPTGSHQKRRYELAWSEGGWFKLPCQAIVRSGVILPFQNFTLRSKHELYAMKIYLYLAARRDNYKDFTLASYETISESAKVPERHIRKALVTLSLTGLLVDINRDREDGDKVYGPNMYYLAGHHQLFKAASAAATTAAAPALTSVTPPPPARTAALTDLPF